VDIVYYILEAQTAAEEKIMNRIKIMCCGSSIIPFLS